MRKLKYLAIVTFLLILVTKVRADFVNFFPSTSTFTPTPPSVFFDSRKYGVSWSEEAATGTLSAGNTTIPLTLPDWVAATNYSAVSPWSIVQPLTNNTGRHIYKCIDSGTSGSGPNPWCSTSGCLQTDGTVIWKEIGTSIPAAIGFTAPIVTNGVSYPMGTFIANAGVACSINGGGCAAPGAPTVYQTYNQVSYVPTGATKTILVGGTPITANITPGGGNAPNGVLTSFSGTLAHIPLISTFCLTMATSGGVDYGIRICSDGNPTTENLQGWMGASGTLDTTNGNWTFNSPFAPSTGSIITASYQWGSTGHWKADAGVANFTNKEPFIVGTPGQGIYGISAGTYTYGAFDAGRLTRTLYGIDNPPTGTDSVCYKVRAKDVDGGFTPASVATCVSNIIRPGATQTNPMMIIPAAYTGATKFLIYEQVNGTGAYFLAGVVWPTRDSYFLDWGGPTVANPWVEEDSPVDDSGNNPGNDSLYTTVSSVTGNSIVVANAPSVPGTFTVTHNDQPGWRALESVLGLGSSADGLGAVVEFPSAPTAAVSRTRVWGPWVTTSVTESLRFEGGTPYNTVIRTFGDGGGPCTGPVASNGVIPPASGTNGAAYFNGGPFMYLDGFNLNMLNSTTDCGINLGNNRSKTAKLTNIRITGANWNRSTGVLAELVAGNGPWINFNTLMLCKGIVATLAVDVNGIIGGNWQLPVWPCLQEDALIEYGSSFLGFGADHTVNMESPWQEIRPINATAASGNSANIHWSPVLGDPPANTIINGVTMHPKAVEITAAGNAWEIGPLQLIAQTVGNNSELYGIEIRNGSKSINIHSVSAATGSGINAYSGFHLDSSNFVPNVPGGIAINAHSGGMLDQIDTIQGSATADSHEVGLALGYGIGNTFCATSSRGRLNYLASNFISLLQGLVKCTSSGVVWNTYELNSGWDRGLGQINPITEAGGGGATPDLNMGVTQKITISDNTAFVLAAAGNTASSTTGTPDWILQLVNGAGAETGVITVSAYTNTAEFLNLGLTIANGKTRTCLMHNLTFERCTDSGGPSGFAYANHTTALPADGESGYCKDCTVGTCSSAGSGALMVRSGGAYNCY